MNLEDYRIECGWSKNEMARQARIDVNTLNRAMSGDTVSSTTAKKLALAISKEIGRTIRFRDIDGLNVNV